MAALAHRDADRYIDRPDRGHFLFLVFGADHGLIYERARRLLAATTDDAVAWRDAIELSGDAIASDPLLLIDEAHSIGLFDTASRAIRVNLGAKSVLPALEMIERSPPSNSVIILIAGDLKRDAAIRKWIEKQPFAASIECAMDDARDVQRLLDAELKRANLSIEPEAREILAETLGDDRLSTRSEIEKLLLYAKDQSTVTVEQINDLLLDATAVDLDSILSAIFTGETETVAELSNKVSFADIDANRLFAAVLRYALAIHRARGEIDGGARQDESFQSLLRLVNGFKRKDSVAKELQLSRLDKTTDFITAAYDALKTSRQRNILTDERLLRLLLAMAQSTRSRAKQNRRRPGD
ncbi:DNA polymerase III subunit delta [Rhodoblastus sp.]|uniref:DNA polymerase III subunit delta n=1 Tax=Rhodoblastus sp. TaxID=1962975 RepID=UPI0035B4C8E7